MSSAPTMPLDSTLTPREFLHRVDPPEPWPRPTRAEALTGGPDVLRRYAREAVAAHRQRRRLEAGERSIEAGRCALLSHLHTLTATGRSLDDEAATEIVVAVILAWLDEEATERRSR